MKIYIAGAHQNLHVMRLLGKELSMAGHQVLQRRNWWDAKGRANIFAFCSSACASVDLVIYIGESGQDAGVEVGIAWAAGVPILGIAGPLEEPGVMLSCAVSAWVTLDALLEDPAHVSALLVTASLHHDAATNGATA